jgi:LmbE family N-acetylglucosaminyl deacetylase
MKRFTFDAPGCVAPAVVVLSPHCDDAAFSLAGVLKHALGLGKRTTIITCFSCSSYAPKLIFRSPTRVTQIRKREDTGFGTWLHPSCELIWLDWEDAALRDDRRRIDVCSARPLSGSDLDLTAKLAEVLRGLVDPTSVILLPFGVGSHVDHRIVREAGLSLAAEGCSSLFFYEDLPYAAEYSLQTLDNWIAGFSFARLFRVEPRYMSFAELLSCKTRAALCYKSQVTRRVVERIVGHARRLDPSGPGAERVWQVSYPKTREEMRAWAHSVEWEPQPVTGVGA